MHFPDGYPWLTLSAIPLCEARTFLTVIPFGNIPRDRSSNLQRYYNTNVHEKSIENKKSLAAFVARDIFCAKFRC